MSALPAGRRGLPPEATASIERLFHEHLQRGWHPAAQLSVIRDGAVVVDLAGGFTSEGRALTSADRMLLFSSGKPLIAVAVLMLCDRGLLSLDDRIAAYWPEFAQGGKGDATVRHALTHQAGCPQLPEDFDLNHVDDWDYAVAQTASVEASWPPGSEIGYHTLTFGWILGELVRRVDGRMPRQFVTEEIAAPLGVAGDISIGLESPESPESPEVASRVRVCAMSERTRHDPTGREQATSRIVEAFNSEIVARAQIPAANAFGTARALAAFYAALLEDRVAPRPRLLARDTALAATSRQVETPRDRSQDVPKRYGLGFYVSGYEGDPFDFHEGPAVFGHSGQQSSVAYGDPALGVAVAYVTNGLHEPDIVHRRITEMARAIRAACG